MVAQRSVIEIGLLLYPGVQTAALHGLTDLFTVAERIAGEQAGARLPGLRISHWAAEPGDEPRRVFDTHPEWPDDSDGRLAAVLVPPSLFGLPEATPVHHLTQWLAARHGAGAIIGSVCIGGLLVAEAGLLDGRSATAHWSGAEAFARRFPKVRLEPHKPIVDDGDLITSAGLMAWSEVGLRVVDRLLGPSIASRTARFLVVEHSDSAQHCGSNFAPLLGHGDAAILKVQHWLQANGAVDVSLPAMAAQAGLEERTFLRRFRAATGLKPTEYCQHLRVGKARELLEFTNGTVDRIAFSVGYLDPGTFRSTFRKITGMAPSDYRKRFGARQVEVAARG
ncbi:GlxA family transcriptional regulator [Pseudomonas sp. ZM23]|uniref:GlxA family transcriptional regulator n=1 Tax=Pseudomonas triclosanedens TaxID=2961893 RepID=A0ABY7A3F4_9PSED|nr:GlxA family transcriptional regulator [Pseudomonas triclosanedens]MCP8464460.1 GlxA family transcriptional regulator [Pseudomonas triclosanedens]MCP8471594.1 GlxA family transcriptional regulator [Pseudomonas triclosanedens]MCP8477594.1 GlxA family transcriptional regulator [Pseudomonas triclosanedens]WAI51056.1 GlxA family transcriptional regulator [Pseudomonas triclosanedens]